MTYTVEAEGLTRSFGDLHVLRGLDLRVRAGSVLALLGPNGAGKTTTVRILSTLLRPDGGRARVAGHDVAAAPRRVRAGISLTGQSAAVDEMLTGEENLRLMARLRRLRGAAARARTAELLERFDLADAARRRVSTYSGGMRRRLDIAMSQVSDPPVIFLDEPTTGLDPRSRRGVWESVERIAAAGATVLLTTQYLDEADRLADRIALIDGGRVVAEGTGDELKARVGSETVELFFGDDVRLAEAHAAFGPAAHADPSRLLLRVPADGSAAAVKDALDLLERRAIPVVRLGLERPSLDDVFLTLTERS